MPWLRVSVIRSPDIGVIGVGEGSTPYLRAFLLDFLRLDPNRLYADAQPTWKLGIRLEWGPSPAFNYSFQEKLTPRIAGLARSSGFYCEGGEGGFETMNLDSALMSANRVAVR